MISKRRKFKTVCALLFVVGNVSTYPKKVSTNPGVFDLFNNGHMSKVQLPVNFWKRLPGQEKRKSGTTVSGVGVRHLTNYAQCSDGH